MEHALAGISVTTEPSLRAAIEARVLLQREIEHVVMAST